MSRASSDNTSSRVRRTIYLAVLLAILLSVILNVTLPWGKGEYSDSPTSYATFSEYALRHIVRTGHVLEEDDVPLRTPYTSGVLVGDVRFLFLRYYSMIVLVIDGSPLESREVRPFIGVALLISLISAACLIAKRVSKKTCSSITNHDYAFISVFTILSTPSFIRYLNGGFGSSAVVSWVLILFILSLLLVAKRKAERPLLIVFLLSLSMLYYTPALVFLVMLTSLFVYQIIVRKKILPSNLVFLYIVLFFAFYMFVATGFFTTMALAIPKFISFFQAESRVSVLDPYVISGSPTSQVLHLFNAILVSVPVFYYFFIGNKHLKGAQHLRHTTLGLILSLIPLCVFFYLWAGDMGVYWRLTEWGSLVSVIVLCVATVSIRERGMKFVKVLALGAVIIAPLVVLYNSPTIATCGKITQSEEKGQIWLAQGIAPSDVVFTDHRLIGSFVMEEHLNVQGVNDHDNPALVEKELRAIYYEDDPESAYSYLTREFRSDYLFFSSRMTTNPPGIKGFDYFFRPAPSGFERKFERSPKFLRIYDNGVSFSYRVLP